MIDRTEGGFKVLSGLPDFGWAKGRCCVSGLMIDNRLGKSSIRQPEAVGRAFDRVFRCT